MMNIMMALLIKQWDLIRNNKTKAEDNPFGLFAIYNKKVQGYILSRNLLKRRMNYGRR